MKQIVVKQIFKDKYDNSILYQVGDTLSFADGRAADVVSRGLAEYLTADDKAATDEVKPEAPKRGRKKRSE